MNQHIRNFSHETSSSREARANVSLDQMDVERLAQHIVAYTPTPAEIEHLFDSTRGDLGSAINLSVIRRVLSNNPDTVHAFATRDRHDALNPKAEGFIAWLPLTGAGLAALLDGTLNGADPDSRYVAAQNEPPAAIYIWALHAPGRLAPGIAWAFQRWSMPLCRNADIYARTVTPAGRRFAERIGFEQISRSTRTDHDNLLIFRRSRRSEDRPLYDSFPSELKKYTATVVRSLDELQKVVAIRSVVFISGQECPYEEEFDGNDLCATHLLGFAGNEPAACLRIRYFANFAKLERVAVLPDHRQSRLALVLIKAAHELCQMKGYTKVYGHAQKRLADFWARSGARPFPGAREFTFSDHDYVEMLAEIPPHPNAIEIGADPLLIVRPEGRWHRSGVLDSSKLSSEEVSLTPCLHQKDILTLCSQKR